MADRALENNTLALRNSPRRDLLREGMDRLKCPLEVRSLLHIRMLELASVSAVPVSISYARSTGKNYLTGEGQETLALLDRGSETIPLPSHSTTETKGISDSGTKNGLCFNLALRVPNVMTHCPVGPLDPFPGKNPASPHPALPLREGQNNPSPLSGAQELALEVKSQPGSHLCSTAKPRPEHRSSFVYHLLEKMRKTKTHKEENKTN